MGVSRGDDNESFIYPGLSLEGLALGQVWQSATTFLIMSLLLARSAVRTASEMAIETWEG